MNIADMLIRLAEKIPNVFNAGHSKGYTEGEAQGIEQGTEIFMNAFTNNYTRTLYNFGYTNFSNFEFATIIKPLSGENLFANYAGEYLPKGIDLSNSGNTSTSAQFTCRNSKLKIFPDINWGVQMRYSGTWQNCYDLKEIKIIRCDENTIFPSAFSQCLKLNSVSFEGTIGQDVSFSNSPLGRKSIEHIISLLSVTSTDKTLTLKPGQVDTEFETSEGAKDGRAAFETLIAGKTNWKFSY